MTKIAIRNYNLPDANLVMKAHEIHKIFMDNIAAFSAFDSRLNAAYGAVLEVKIEEAVHQSSHSRNKAIQRQLTEEVHRVMELCRNKYITMRYFSKEAFRDNPAVANEFGKKEYVLCRNKQYKMAGFMDELHATCLKYETELLGAGLAVGEIAMVETLGNRLRAANKEQENYKRTRIALTEERINVHNECYAMMMTIMRAGKIIFRNDYGRYIQFVLNKAGKREEEE